MISKKWTVFILYQLLEYETLNFNNLQNRITKKSGEKISATVLSGSLSHLEENGIITRKVISDRMPVRVIYSLTEKGREMRLILKNINDWTMKWRKESEKDHQLHCNMCKMLPNLDYEKPNKYFFEESFQEYTE